MTFLYFFFPFATFILGFFIAAVLAAAKRGDNINDDQQQEP